VTEKETGCVSGAGDVGMVDSPPQEVKATPNRSRPTPMSDFCIKT
jgi:hypothetical protein